MSGVPATRPPLTVLLPPGRPAVAPDDDARLDALYAEPALPWVRANMITTLDGGATGPDGRSGSINGPADARVFEALRARADVVLVGAGTVRAEGYRAPRLPGRLRPLRHARGQGDHPLLAIVTARGDVPEETLRDDPAPVVVTTVGAPGLPLLRRLLPPDRLVVHDGAVDLARAVRALVDAGLPRILSEGGPTLLGALLAAGLVDELCLTWSPVLVGDAGPRVVGAPLAPPRDARLVSLLHGDGMLLGRWLLGANAGPPTDTLEA